MPKGLAEKVKIHNAKSKYKVTTGMLQTVYNRGVGAYRTNPSSVRPNVTGPEQWAMARVNSYLKIVAGSKSPKHDKDLLPSGHPSSTKKMDDGYYVDKADKPLNKPFRLPAGSSKKFGVYVKDGDKTKKVTFGDPNMEIRRDDPKARANFRSRHSCDTATDKTSARYWSCRMWSGATVGSMTKAEEDFKPHQMYNSKTGEAVMAATYEQHLDLKERGYTHNKPLTKSIEGQILKADEEQRLVYGWASVVTEKGEPVVDRQGDVIEPDTLVKAVNNFMEHIRVGKQMHTGEQIGAVIHSMPITKEIGESLGIQSDREGWIVAFKVYDEDVWAKVKSGELAAFSIGGRAIKEDYSA